MKYCEECGCDSYIKNVRVKPDGRIVRRRVCQNCGFVWHTVEISDTEYERLKRKKDA